ncbi:hypothetical protein Tco_1127154 [Tanacetum coccineum]
MEANYSYNSYPESGGSSPHSREIDFDNPPPWEDQSNTNTTNYKVKLMCSYGGKIHPRPHDNQLAYIGGETKIMAVNRASPKPARLRLFLFPAVPVQNPVISPVSSFNDSIEGRSDRDRFVDALNTGPVPVPVPVQSSTQAVLSVYEMLIFLNIAPAPVPVQVQVSAPAQAPVTKVRDFLDADLDGTDRIQKHIQDLQRLRISEDQQLQQQHQQMMYRRQSEDSMTSGYAGDYYRQAEKVTTTLPGSVPVPVSGYQMSGGFTGGDQPPVYMVPSSAGVYHAPMAKPVPGPIGPAHGQNQVHGQGQGQGYYAVYNGFVGCTTSQQQPPQLQPQPQPQQMQHQYQAMGGGLGTLSQDGKVIAPTKNSPGSI